MKTFYNIDEFPFVKAFANNWEVICNEYKKVSEHMVQWPEKHLHDNNWEVFGLFGFPNGDPIEYNCELCPETVRLIKENIKHTVDHCIALFNSGLINEPINTLTNLSSKQPDNLLIITIK